MWKIAYKRGHLLYKRTNMSIILTNTYMDYGRFHLCLFCSASGEYLLTGTANGCVRVHPLPAPHSLADLSSYWALTSIATSFDDQYVLSGAADGNVFIYRADLPTAAERAKAATVLVRNGFMKGRAIQNILGPVFALSMNIIRKLGILL